MIIFFCNRYIARQRNYWKSQNVAHEEFSFILGPAKRLLLKPICLSDQERYKKYGRLFGAYEGAKPCLFVAEPDLIKQVLLRDFQHVPNKLQQRTNSILDSMIFRAAADRWRSIRTVWRPAFSSGKLRKNYALIQNCAIITSNYLKEAAERNEDIDMAARDIRGRITFATELVCGGASATFLCFMLYYNTKNCLYAPPPLPTRTHSRFALLSLRLFGPYSLDVIARCAFGTRFYSHPDSTNEFVTEVNKASSARRMSWKVIVATLFPQVSKYFGLSIVADDDLEYFRNICQRLINERRQTGHRHDDFLQLMMDAQEGSLDSNKDNIVKPANKLFGLVSGTKQVSADSNTRLSEIEAMAQCVFSLLAGQVIPTSAITFTVYLLALNPKVQEKLRNEVDECTDTNASTLLSARRSMWACLCWGVTIMPSAQGLEPSMDVMSKLKYLHCVVLEGLRLFPSAVRFTRYSYDDYVLGDTGIKLPKGCSIVIPVYAIHHDPEFFSHPDSFNPERFSDENVESIRPYTYLPFGAGPRNCLGMRFAL
nr:cytochrome P450 3A9-like [Dermacentor andersoni]